MFARVATWEGGDPEAIRRAAAEIAIRAATGPPEGVRSSGFTMLMDPEGGAPWIGLFETQEDLREGEPVLNEMDPPATWGAATAARRAYDVAVEVRMDQAAR